MLYMVKEIAKLTGVTVKTLHYYHKIGLLEPSEISEAGYRLYGTGDLERLQQILFYRELDFSLKDIKIALENEPNRLNCLLEQQKLLNARRQRLDCLLKTLDESIILTKKGVIMDKLTMFQGLNKEEWNEALTEQNEYLKDKYNYDMMKENDFEVIEMNEIAAEAQNFMKSVAKALKDGLKASDERVQKMLEQHIAFLNEHSVEIDAKALAIQSKFFLEDDFHRNMLESQQTGLSYYLCFATEMYASGK
ncbi:MerR family transcriptional regulator [Clostridium sp. UBA4548]|uniref:MerR family transcriptional regulator n=1 Tax=Clostridium sp. UBA4548 TaxID=1946361 RepID=UPI0025BF86BD|nr:MerR family transcriptional regulator [Clostridium sp. UBA4548]